MKRFGTWLSTSKPTGHLGSSKSLTAIDEPAALQDAMRSAALIMNDEVEKAETELSNGTSPFHKLGHATCLFMRATLGFEKDVMEQASARLAEAEESASEHQKRAMRDPQTAHQSKIYPTGSEYALCHAETQIMAAVIGVLNESLTESLRGFYKLRRAFATLQEIIAAENRYMERHQAGMSKDSLASTGSGLSPEKSASKESSGVVTPVDDSDDENFEEAAESLSEQPTPLTYQGNVDFPDMSSLELQDTLKPADHSTSTEPSTTDQPSTQAAGEAREEDFDFSSITSDPIDQFIHSGTALCYGTLQLLLSLIPPAFGKILSILSFRGDRKNGFRLLWRATAAKSNINGAFAGLIVLGFHNAAIGLCDIHGKEAYPEARLRQLLQDMRAIYPRSIMWILEEGRMAGLDRQLERAYEIMHNNPAKSTLRQMNALRVFETAMNLMFRHQYQECADTFLQCVELNSWSHGMYYYIAGCCHVELYRRSRESDPQSAKSHMTKASELLLKATEHTGKRRLMARQLPLDVYINRKITKWTARSKARQCDIAEAVGVSPVEEMIYFWAGFKRMGPEHLRTSLERLAWSEDHKLNPSWQEEPIDERAMLALLKATCLRSLGEIDEARTILTEQVMCHDWQQLKACEHADSWSLPVAHYENAVCYWQEAGGENGDKELLAKCSEEIAKVEKWESFELEARIGMKIKTARVTLDGLRVA